MKRFLAVLLLGLATLRPAHADFTYSFDPDWSHAEGLAGLHLNRNTTDAFAHGITFDYNGLTRWQVGLDQTLDYSYPGVSPTPPDLVLAYRGGFATDNLRMRWDDARMELGAIVGHPVLPFQFTISAGTATKQLGGLAIGTYGYQHGLYLFNRGTSKRNTINLQNVFCFQTDTPENGTGDFQMYNFAAASATFKVSPTNDFRVVSAKEGFFNATPVTKPTVTGSWTDGTAQKSVLAALVSLGLATDNTTP